MVPSDLLLLDVLIPKKTDGVPQAKNSIALLSDICSAKKAYIRPRLIMGLTADISELGVYQSEFANEATVVLSGTLTDIGWIDRLLQQIESLLGTHRKESQNTKDRVLISVHGIRTYGQWQTNLSKEISDYSRSFECVEIKYGFTDLLSFLIPKLRNRAVEKAAQRVIGQIRKNQNRDIFIVAHSFGTLVVEHAIRTGDFSNPLKAVILCGSPLGHAENIDKLVQSSEITINECGIHDTVLLFARFFGLGLGDAGRVGFERENSDSFRNRYFSGGHGLYFGKFGEGATFYERFWLPFIISGEDVFPFDERRDYFGQDLVDLIVKFMTFIKPGVYCMLLLILFVQVVVFLK
jgi:hypothetical protein